MFYWWLMLHRGPMSRQHYSKNFYVFPLPANTPPRHSFRVGPPREEDIKMLIVCKRLKEFNVVHPPARTQGWGVLLGSRDPAPPPPAHYLFIINTFTDNCVVSCRAIWQQWNTGVETSGIYCISLSYRIFRFQSYFHSSLPVELISLWYRLQAGQEWVVV